MQDIGSEGISQRVYRGRPLPSSTAAMHTPLRDGSKPECLPNSRTSASTSRGHASHRLWPASCKVEMWRGGCRSNISVSASFVWRCLSGATMTPFPHPSHRTGHEDFPHPALGQDSRLHPRHVVPKPAQAHEPEVPVKVREWIRPALASPDRVLEAQPPAQPHSGVVSSARYAFVTVPTRSSSPIRAASGQLLHQLCGLLPSPRSGGERMDVLDHALDALPRWPVPQIRLSGSR